jgi:hypothetical protein
MTIATDILKQRSAVSQPQRKLLAVLLATMLALRGRVTARNLSRYCEYAERTRARQFRASFAWSDFPQRVLTAARDPRSDLLAAQEASFIPKSGKQTFGLGHFFNGCASRAERGWEISTLAVVEVTHRCAFTLAVAQTPPGAGQGTRQPAGDETRMDFYQPHLPDHRHRVPPTVPSQCVDGDFAKKKYLDEVVALQLHPLPTLRHDANCRFLYTGPHPKRRGPKRKYDGKVNFHDLGRFTELGPLEERDQVPLYPALVWPVSLKPKLRGVVLVNRQDPPKPRFLVLAATDLALHGRKVVEFYGARFQLEFLFRDSQPFPGLSDCQARAEAALDFHCNAALATLNRARAEARLVSPDPSSQVFSLASWKQRHFNERLLAVFIENVALDPTWVKNQPCYDELRTYGAIAA